MVKKERTGKRSLAYSNWHRLRMPPEALTTDVDWVEYRRKREAVAIVETKYGDATTEWSQRRVLQNVADERPQLPLFQVNYKHGDDPEDWNAWSFAVEPLNETAQNLDHIPTGWVAEAEYIVFLMSL